MTLDEAYGCSSPVQYLARLSWIHDNKVYDLISCAKTLEEIKMELSNSPEVIKADDWNIFEVRE